MGAGHQRSQEAQGKTVMDNSIDWKALADAAWRARDHAHLYGKTAVGAALLTREGLVFAGCNIEHRYRCHDVHAEVAAISTMVSNGYKELIAIFVAAERERFTPCGSCMDWIFQFGGEGCLVGYQRQRDLDAIVLTARELMPFYPG